MVLACLLHSGLFGALSGVAAEDTRAPDPLAWPTVTRQSRPWTYNWWPGSAVDTNNLAREIRRYKDAGLGGIHIIPIYGAKGAKGRNIDYLSPRWMDMLQFAVQEAGRQGLGVDMTTGTGWCFGGPNVPETQGGWRLQTRLVQVAPGQQFREQAAATNVLAALVETGDGKRVDLRSDLSASGELKWAADAMGAQVYIVTAAPGGPEVKRAAPGGIGPMLNPFDPAAMTHYLERFTAAFDGYHGPLPRSMYHDSYEYNSSWAPDVLNAFARLRGYRLEEYWPALCQQPQTNDTAARVRADFKETLSDLMVEDVFPEWIRWSHARGMVTRYQAHGSPANLLDLYALADIPETEMFGRGSRDPLTSGFDEHFGEGDRDPLVSKFASSAAHLTGRPLVSSETGTWMAEHFCETLEEMKCLVDLLFVSGINHVFYHGTCYSPDDVAWPGWLFYAATEMNPRNAIWHDVGTLNTYISRCQSVLQSGRPDNDILLYWPIHDYWHSAPGLVTGLTVHNRSWLTDQPIGACARRLWQHGYAFDYVSDRLLVSAQTTTGNISLSGNGYRVVVVPESRLIPPETLRKLLRLAETGATVIFENQLPQDVPGQADLTRRRAALKETFVPLSALKQGEVRVGQGRVLVGELEQCLAQAGVPREGLTDHPGALFIRRSHPEGRHYFIANQGTAPMKGWFALAQPARSVVALDPMTGRTGVLPVRTSTNGSVEVPLWLEPGHSVLLRAFRGREVTGTAWQWLSPGQETCAISGPWHVEFLSGGPSLPKALDTPQLASWTRNGDQDAEAFAGTALYRTTFDAPPTPGPWLLDLGRVCHSARVRLNGQDLGTVFLKPYRLPVSSLKPTGNVLEVEVTNLSANRLRDLDRRKVSWRNFYFVDLHYKPFDASSWPVLDSGLLGPVALRSIAPLGH